jgi:hypothetical protein
MKQWHFFEKVYRVWVVLAICEPDEFYAFMEQCGYKEIDDLRQGSTTAWCITLNTENNDRGNDCHIIWMRKFESACLVHELSHLVMAIFTDKGVPTRHENTEAFAYYQEFWFNEMNRVRRRLPNGRDPKIVKRSV